MSDSPKTPKDATPGMAFERPIRELEVKLAELKALSVSTNFDISGEIAAIERQIQEEIARTYADLSAWERVNVARHAERPVTGDYVAGILDDFLELHGDKVFGDDRAMLTGLATIGERRFLLVGHRKGRTTPERLACNFGCAHPEGYRKALSKMRLAEKLDLPIVSFINTPGAYPGIGAEERGQARAIAENILAMFSLRVPILVIVIGEGGSGGALGIGIGDRVLMMEHAYYSVISPEGCAAILWKDGERTPDAAEALKLTAPDLRRLGLVDGVIREPAGGAHRDHEAAFAEVRRTILAELDALDAVPRAELALRRRRKYRRAGYLEGRFPDLLGGVPASAALPFDAPGTEAPAPGAPPEPAGPEQAGPEQAGPERGGPEPVGPEQRDSEADLSAERAAANGAPPPSSEGDAARAGGTTSAGAAGSEDEPSVPRPARPADEVSAPTDSHSRS